MNKRIFKTISFAFAVITIILISACSNDEDYWGLKSVDISDVKRTSRATYIDCSDYLTISSYEMEHWTEEDFEAFDAATNRIGVSFSDKENKYIFEEPNGQDINISDSLYDCVIDMFEFTNSLLNSSSNTFNGIKAPRMKLRASEASYSPIETERPQLLPDCVPAAISRMGRNAPSYEDAIKKCNELFPEWKSEGGVPINGIEMFIEEYAPVTAYTELDHFEDGVSPLESCVMPIGSSGSHTVNAVKVKKGKYSTIVYYRDYSAAKVANGTGSTFMMNVYCIYLFD